MGVTLFVLTNLHPRPIFGKIQTLFRRFGNMKLFRIDFDFTTSDFSGSSFLKHETMCVRKSFFNFKYLVT